MLAVRARLPRLPTTQGVGNLGNLATRWEQTFCSDWEVWTQRGKESLPGQELEPHVAAGIGFGFSGPAKEVGESKQDMRVWHFRQIDFAKCLAVVSVVYGELATFGNTVTVVAPG